jgi:hypothetical protein
MAGRGEKSLGDQVGGEAQADTIGAGSCGEQDLAGALIVHIDAGASENFQAGEVDALTFLLPHAGVMCVRYTGAVCLNHG